MANFVGDLSSSYNTSVTLFATSTGVSTSANAEGVSLNVSADVSNVFSAFLIVGNAGGTSPTLNMKMQESTDGTTYTDITSGAFTQVTTSNQKQMIPIQPTKQYVRCTGTVAGTSPVFEATVGVIYPLRTAPNNVGGFSNASAAG
jgi:hypothetical protein